MRDLTEREVRALTQYLTVLPHAPDVHVVVSGSGDSHTVDARVAFATGRRPIPAWVDREDLPRDFSAHVDVDPDFQDRPDATDDSDMVIA
jgi:hypothetical protein